MAILRRRRIACPYCSALVRRTDKRCPLCLMGLPPQTKGPSVITMSNAALVAGLLAGLVALLFLSGSG